MSGETAPSVRIAGRDGCGAREKVGWGEIDGFEGGFVVVVQRYRWMRYSYQSLLSACFVSGSKDTCTRRRSSSPEFQEIKVLRAGLLCLS